MKLDYTQKLMQLEQMRDNRKMRELQYDTALLRLQEAKDEARRRRESAASLVGIQEEYNSVLNNDQLTGRQKRMEKGKLDLKYANLFEYNPAVRHLSNAAGNAITLDPREEQRSKLTFENYVLNNGDPAYIKDQLPEGFTATDEIPAEVYAEGIRKSKLNIAQAKTELEQTKAEQTQLNELMGKVAGMDYTPVLVYDETKPATGSNVKEPAKLKGGSEAQINSVIDRIPDLTPQQKAQIKESKDVAEKLGIAQRYAANYNLPNNQQSTGSSTLPLWGVGP